ncbi:MAG: glycine-rich protein [Bacteroidota bacterium]
MKKATGYFQHNPLKSIRFILLLFALIVTSAENIIAQGLSVNTTGAAPDTSAMLDVSSTIKGTLITRMTTVQRNSIALPATGLIIFNTDCSEFQYYSGSGWVSILNSNSTMIAGAISGSALFCSGQTGVSYSVVPVVGATSYLWSVPPGAVITSGQGTNAISVNFGSTPGIISVSVTNGCSTSAASVLATTLTTVITTPGAINGLSAVCSGQSGVIYSISAVPGATSYNWSLPAGATITAGAGTTAITVTFGSNPGNVSVTASNSCGTSNPSNLSVSMSSVPGTPGTVSGPTTVNPNQTGVAYSISAVSGATSYTWTVPSGSTITSGQGTTAIVISFGSTSGNVCVTADNSCGSGTASCLAVSTICYTSGNQTFNYTGAQQTFTVPPCVTSVTLDVYGAQGGGGGGNGGRAQGTLSVTPGQILYVYVGGEGAGYNTGVSVGGWNGGGNGHYGCAGGGGSDVRAGGTALSNRVIVAGGGGGYYGNPGGAGGGTSGGNAPNGPATGGTQSSGGTYCGALGQGGSNPGGMADGGGGGGGYYGGGTNYCAGASPANGSGAGGSGYTGGVTAGTMMNGVRSGNGIIIITW